MLRERWGTRIGLILAMAGNAIGLGNFLRFPVQAAQNGGGVFMIPYMLCLLFIAIPLMWIEWSLGRFGGSRGHGTTPAIFSLMWHHPLAKYIGALGIFIPFIVTSYYIFIESWTLGYAFFAITGSFPHDAINGAGGDVNKALEPFSALLASFTGQSGTAVQIPSLGGYMFFVITMLLNTFILLKGISGGIEKLAKIAMPTLFIMGVILMVRVLTLETQQGSAIEGLNFLWEPKWSELLQPKIWLAAAGQVFFTLSLGFGCIITYASYLKRNDDIVISGLSASSLNTVAEVIIGGSIAIPAAVAFFGLSSAQEIAKSGSFNLGFVSMLAIFSHIALGNFFGFIWFMLLFFAGLTSSVAIIQPVIAFLEDEFKIARKKAVLSTMLSIFIVAHVPIFFKGALDEMDFWVGTLALVVLALAEALVFFWAFGHKKAWQELNRGGIIKIPRFFVPVMRYVTPAFLFLLLAWWSVESLPTYLKDTTWHAWIARFTMIGVWGAIVYMIYSSTKRRRMHEG